MHVASVRFAGGVEDLVVFRCVIIFLEYVHGAVLIRFNILNCLTVKLLY